MDVVTSHARIRKALLTQDLTLEQLVIHYLDKIGQYPDTNAYVRVFSEEALQKARTLDREKSNSPGDWGKLYGMVVSVKDNICIKDKHVTAGSRILRGYRSPFHATAIQRILEEDAIIIGATNCDAFGMGSTSEYSAYGPVEQGKHPGYIAGGSSGGSAVAVQTGTCLVSLGSDTGGSVRQPAAMTGLIGLKPGYGRVSRYGLIAYASSFDQIGILGTDIDDVAKLLGVISGPDVQDSSTSVQPVDHYHEVLTRKGSWRFGVLENALKYPGLDPEIRNGFTRFLDRISDGYQVVNQHFEDLDYVVPTYYVLAMAEASSNLARYDGVRYGHREDQGAGFDEMVLRTRTEGFGTEVKRRIMSGTFVLSAGYYTQYFEQAQKVRARIKNQLTALLEDVDAILLPTIPTTAWKVGEKINDPVTVYLSDVFTVPANLAGLPAASIPLGQTREGFDFGLQILVKRFEEHKLIQIIRDLNVYHT